MNSVHLAFAISLPIITLGLFAFVGFLLVSFFGVGIRLSKGLSMFRLDIYSRKISKIDSGRREKFIIRGFGRKKNPSLKQLSKSFISESNVEKQFRDVLNRIRKDPEKCQKIEFISGVPSQSNKHQYKFKISFSPFEETDDFIMTIAWKIVIKERKKKNIEIKHVDKEYVVNKPEKIKGFIAFNLNHDILNATTKLINIFNFFMSKFSKKGIVYFKNNDTLIITFFGETTKSVTKKMRWFMDKVKVKAFGDGAKTLFSGSGYIALKDIDSNKELLKACRALDFFVILSIEEKRNFISNQDKSFDIENYKKYSAASKSFRAALRTGDLKTQLIPVKSRKTNKKVIEYAYPKINGLNDNMLRIMLTNRNNYIDLIDAHVKKIGIKTEAGSPILIDINSDWLITNYKKLKYKKAIYVIIIKQDTRYDVLEEVINWMGDNRFFFAIRIKNFTETIATLINQTCPQFILIDKSAWSKNGLANTKTFIDLLTIKKLADTGNIKIIYENPSKLVDKKMAEKINMNFYYNM